jgi:hypothetical protein
VAVSTLHTVRKPGDVRFSLYLSSFHACRYPTIPKDTAHKFDPPTHNHVVFIRNNRFFEVELAHPDGTEVSVADLETYAFFFELF